MSNQITIHLDRNSPLTNFLLGVALSGGNVKYFIELLNKGNLDD